MHDIHKTLYLMAIRDEDLLNEGLKAKAAAGMIPPPEPKQTQQTPTQTQQTPPPTTQNPTIKVPYDRVLEKTGFTQRDYDTFRTTMAEIESGGKYDIVGGSNKHYDGRYQLSKVAKTDGARTMGVPDPGHDTAARQAFRSNPDNQEELFAGFTIANHNYLMKKAPGYASKTKQQQLQILGYAHNQGMGGAAKWIETGVVDSDGFGTKGTKYTESLRAAYTLDNETVAAKSAKDTRDSKVGKVGDFIVSDGRALPTIGHTPQDAPKIATPTTEDPSHSVVKGDTLGAIAKKNNTSVEELMKSNPDIKDANKIEINQKIKIRTIKKESYKDKIRMHLREVFEQLPGSNVNFDYGDVFGDKGIMSPESARWKEPGDLELSDRAIRTRTDSKMPGVVETIGHRVGSEPFGGILRVRSETNMDPQHPHFKKIETHVYDGGTRIGSFTSRFTYGHTHTSSMAHDMTNNFNFKKGSNSEQLTNRKAMDAGAQEFFQRALNQPSELSDLAIDTNLQRVVERHFNETMGGRRNKKISEYHRGLEGTENPSDGPGDGSSYGELT